MRILQLLPHLPVPTTSGGRQRSFQLLSRLKQRHHVAAPCFVKPDESQFLSDARRYCHTLHPTARPASPSERTRLALAASRRPLAVEFFRRSAAREILRQALQGGNFDVVHVEGYYLADL